MKKYIITVEEVQQPSPQQTFLQNVTIEIISTNDAHLKDYEGKPFYLTSWIGDVIGISPVDIYPHLSVTYLSLKNTKFKPV